MRKFFTVAAISLVLAMSGASGATAQTYCITFDNFCDLIEVTVSDVIVPGTKVTSGLWDAVGICGGQPDLSILGELTGGENGVSLPSMTVAGRIPFTPWTTGLYFNDTPGQMDFLVLIDGFYTPFLVLSDGFTPHPGTCPFGVGPDGEPKPRLLDALE